MANQPNAGGIEGPTNGRISGAISFPESMLAQGFNSNACRALHVVAEIPAARQPKQRYGVLNLAGPVMTVYAKAGRLTGRLDGNTVDCAYSIQNLTAGHFTVVPSGKPWGYKPGGGHEEAINPVEKVVSLNRYGLNVAKKSNVDFSIWDISQPK
ncbi:MAG: hypothetical protein ACLPYS_11470 [Vulcanimicrobiaceae bacterium]